MTTFRPVAIATALLLAHVVGPQAALASELPAEVERLLPEIAAEWGMDPAIVAAVEAQNARGVSLDQIRELDRRWQDTSGLAAFMLPFFDNAAAEALGRLEGEADYVLESFAMDDQGAIVAATNKTSDYWQGDEDKFTESFRDGAGAIHIGEVEFDESAQAYIVQVSVPVLSEGVAIGAVTIGVDLGTWE